MKIYAKRQNKKSLGIDNLKGVSVKNNPTNGGFTVKYRAEVKVDGNRYTAYYVNSSQEAAKDANGMFKSIYGNARAAKKAGYWNTL